MWDQIRIIKRKISNIKERNYKHMDNLPSKHDEVSISSLGSKRKVSSQVVTKRNRKYEDVTHLPLTYEIYEELI